MADTRLDESVTISTPENVSFTFELAGLGSRFIALLVDMFVQFVIFWGVAMGIYLVGLGAVVAVAVTMTDKTAVARVTGAIVIGAVALIILAFFLIGWSYFILFEVRSGGQTPGKRLMNLRVLRDKGQPVRFFDSAIRNILRAVDWLPGMYMVGIVSILANRSNQRIGDIAAGTMVVREARAPAPGQVTGPAAVESEHAALVAEYLQRCESMSSEGRLATARALVKLLGMDEEGDEAVLTERLRGVVSYRLDNRPDGMLTTTVARLTKPFRED